VQVQFQFVHGTVQVGDARLLGGSVDRFLGLMGIIEERKHAVILPLAHGVVFVVMALGALDGEA
jgi:hypothetical protein